MTGHRWVAAPERAVDRGAPRASPRPKRGNGIPALDGIRAVAVGLVLADHGGIPGVGGGFIGVDVFFVLSGFLITSLLLDELGRTGTIDLPGFWVRRARRLLPALIVMVLAVVVLRELFPSDAVAAVRDDAVGAFFWVANWVFVFRDTDYFTQGDPPSPLQHTWSLAVEEQYYVLWPLVLLAVAVAARTAEEAPRHQAEAAHGPHGRRRRRRRGCGGLGGRVMPDGVWDFAGLAEPRLLRHRHPRAGPARRRRGGSTARA